MTAHEILEAARQLPQADQLWFARVLLRAEVPSTREEIDEAWGAELRRRAAEAESESAAMIPSVDVDTKLEDPVAGPSSPSQTSSESDVPAAVESLHE
jgi:hypothetical protein